MHNPRIRLQHPVKLAIAIACGVLVVPFLLVLLGLGPGQTALALPRPPGAAQGGDAAPMAVPIGRGASPRSEGGAPAIARAPLAPAQVSIVSISIMCNTSTGGYNGTVTLSGNSNATITLGLFFHVPLSSTFTDSNLRDMVTFVNSSTASYSFPHFIHAGPPAANTYRVQVVNADGLGGATTKSLSASPCNGTTTPTITPTRTPTVTVPTITPTRTPTVTPTSSPTATGTATASPTVTTTAFVPIAPTNTSTATPTSAAPAPTATPTGVLTATPTATATATSAPPSGGGGQAPSTPTSVPATATTAPSPTAIPTTVISAAPARGPGRAPVTLPKTGGLGTGALGLLAAAAAGLGWYLRSNRNRRE